MEGEEQKFREMANQEDLGKKVSEKLHFPQKDLNYLCENSCRFLGASTIESNQYHSKRVAENENHDEDQEGVANMICKLFQGISLVIILWNIAISPQCSRRW